ncbi:methionine--tRNA ligase, cytoplasmic isoform X2 [Nematostella vectensis]|uniref:methionine--tRNA ligase, cytoplasmic isoform X2 n=1 Tax=Nematostella vectensis TaxID=45351 RepID=UPI0020770886|nr:methionine--tRNA ligase, cytoplasmic isoform X2 [Nematostella vectensis]
MVGYSAGLFRRVWPVIRISLRYLHNRSLLSSLCQDMRLYSDKGNPFLLRILAARNLAGVKLDVEFTGQGDKSKFKIPGNAKFPVLEVESGEYLSSPNSICRFILEQKSSNHDVESQALDNQWIEWESTLLQPIIMDYLLNTLGHGKHDTNNEHNLMPLLGRINTSLKYHQHLTGKHVSAADVIVWGSLYPLMTTGLVSKFDALVKWNKDLMSKSEFVSAVNDVTLGSGSQAFKASSDVNVQHAKPEVSKQKQTQKQQENKKQKASVKENTEASTETSGAITITKILASAEEIEDAVNAWNHCSANLPTARKLYHPILPKEGEKNILITSALPYVNNVPHLGNIIGCVLSGDVFARYCRIRGFNTLYISGTDEYGTATETKALEEGLTPQQVCDKYHKLHCSVYDWFNIQFDFFGRTTTENQTKIAQDIFWKLHQQNHLVEDTVEQLQCTGCQRFLADRFVEGICPFCNYEDARGDQCDACGKLINATELKSPKCKVCGGTPEKKTSRHLFLNLTELDPKLREWVDKSTNEGNWSPNARQITRSWIQEGLKPRCITRDLKWGTPVPLEGYTDKVFYVWFDAPIGYLSITANYTDQWEKWWKNPKQVTLYQFMAKDNVPFHTVVFPSTLIGANDNYTLLNNISATEYLNYEDDKFSKSRGVGVFGDNAADSGIPADIWRFYLLYMRPEGQDSAFSWSDFAIKNNSELLNNLGNFINRALMFLQNNFAGKIPDLELMDEDTNFIALVNRELKVYYENMDKLRLREGLKVVLNISKYGNQYVQANKPWVLVKGSDAERCRAGTVIGLACNLSFMLSLLIHPYMPTVSKEIQTQLKAQEDCGILTEHFVPFLKPGHVIGTPKPLFQKIDPAVCEKLKAKYAGKKAPSKAKPSATPSSTPAPGAASPATIEALQAEVTQQGEKVRSLKTNKAEKAVIDAEVTRLLELKKKLSLAEGKDPNQPSTGGKSKKKGKGKK